MKIKVLIAIITSVIVFGCKKTTEPEFLYLNSNQLHTLGIELNENGLFYKNFNPNWKQDNGRYSCLSFYCCNDNYLTSNHYEETDTLEIDSRNDSLLMEFETTRNDFYPLLIGNTKGKNSLENKTLSKDLKLLPIAICMADTKLSNRNDTIIIWFKPTESLKQALPKNINIDEYLQVRLTENK